MIYKMAEATQSYNQEAKTAAENVCESTTWSINETSELKNQRGVEIHKRSSKSWGSDYSKKRVTSPVRLKSSHTTMKPLTSSSKNMPTRV